MKEPKDMTREELAEWYDEERDNGNPMDAEIMRRLRNSVDRPKIEVVHDEAGQVWRLLINGTVVVGHPYSNSDMYACNAVNGAARDILAALGMEGGE